MTHNHSIKGRDIPDYDLHMPKSLTYPIPVGIITVVAGSLFYMFLPDQPILAAFLVGITVLAGALYVGLYFFLKRLTNLEHRLKGRDKFLNEIPWQGNETVLDVGCGNGILIMGAAKHLTTGNGIGIEIWTDFSGDSHREAFLDNAKIEEVADRVSLENEDVRQLPYDDESFEVIISGLTMHHLGFDTKKAMLEMSRTLKPGGWIAIYDEPSTIFYCAKLMRQNGLQIEKKTMGMVFGTKTAK